MANRTIEITSYGSIVINPINFNEKEYESVDLSGEPLKWISGTATRGHWVNKEGLEVPNSQMCKKVNVEGEDVLIQKLEPTNKVDMEDIEVTEDNQDIYTAIDRKMYKVFTDSEKIKKLILEEGKSLRFPFVAGNGFKMYDGILTKWQGQIVLCGCRGNINDSLEKYQDNVVDIEVSAIPKNINKKQLLKAMAV